MDWYPLWNSLRIAGISCVIVFFLANIAVVRGMQFLDYHRLKGWGNMIYVITMLMLIALIILV